jgi:hypothetical protein
VISIYDSDGAGALDATASGLMFDRTQVNRPFSLDHRSQWSSRSALAARDTTDFSDQVARFMVTTGHRDALAAKRARGER